MQFDITCTVVVPYSSEKKVIKIGVDPSILSHPDGGQFIVRQMRQMMGELESEREAAMRAEPVSARE
jgi:hypothetical protein